MVSVDRELLTLALVPFVQCGRFSVEGVSCRIGADRDAEEICLLLECLPDSVDEVHAGLLLPDFKALVAAVCESVAGVQDITKVWPCRRNGKDERAFSAVRKVYVLMYFTRKTKLLNPLVKLRAKFPAKLCAAATS